MEKKTTEVAKVQSYELTNNDHTKHLAGVVADFIETKKLFTDIQGKKYVNVEGWLYAGSQLGILPVIVKVEDISRDGEYRYRAEAKLVNIHNQQEVGYGVAMCSNKEGKKKFFDEYAIMSMAETRAVGKAYRLMIGWLMSAAGYSPTPFEEMDNAEVVEEKKKPTAKATEQVEDTSAALSTEQRNQILLLLSHSTITEDERSKMKAKVTTFTEERAAEVIAKLKKTIKEREAIPA